MKYSRFEETPVWQAATELADRILTLCQKPELKPYRSLRDQLERAALSISNNIAEGFERGSSKELLNFLYIARGSAGEVRSVLSLMERRADLANLKSEISNLKSMAEGASRQLRAWADSIQNSPIKGQKFLTEKERQTYQRRKDREEFVQEIRTKAAVSGKGAS